MITMKFKTILYINIQDVGKNNLGNLEIKA